MFREAEQNFCPNCKMSLIDSIVQRSSKDLQLKLPTDCETKFFTSRPISLSHDDEYAAIFGVLFFKIVSVRPRNGD